MRVSTPRMDFFAKATLNFSPVGLQNFLFSPLSESDKIVNISLQAGSSLCLSSALQL